MTVQNVTKTKTVASLSISQDGTYVTYTIGAGKLRRLFGSSDREVVRFLLGDAPSGTVSTLTVAEVGGGHMLEMVKAGGQRYTAALGLDERELVAFLTA